MAKRIGPETIYAAPAVMAALLLVALVVGGCGSTPRATPSTTAATVAVPPPTTATSAVTTTTVASTTPPATTTSSPTTSSPTTSRPTTSAPAAAWRPPAPAPSDYQAAQDLLNAWSEHDRAQALSVASAGAVNALFARAYPADGAQQRGCSAPPSGLPATCVYRYGAADGILSMTVAPFPNGWGVAAVQVES